MRGLNDQRQHVAQVSSEQRDLIERFLNAYNAIDQHFRRTLGVGNEEPFSRLVDQYARGNLSWRDRDDLRDFADMRNILTHRRTRPDAYLFVPMPFVVERIEEIRKRLLEPERVIPRFQRPVVGVQLSDTLSAVLKLITNHDFSQFPVYEERTFRGLLTENGITRWLAHYTVNHESIVDLDEIAVEKLLAEEESRPNFAFFSRNRTVDEAIHKFAINPCLEAILITQHGKKSEQPIGIVTRWDILQLS